MRLAYYAGASTAAAAACLLKAFHERPNFYSATVYLSQSNACLLILTNLLLVGAVAFMYCLQRLLYGPLRPIEIEQLSEKAWYAVLDTLLAMPSFREDVGAWLLTMFVLLLAGKVWGWIAEGRVDILEQQPPANPRIFHARLSTSLLLSVVFDIYMTFYCLETVVADPRPGMMVIFTFEFAILTIFSLFTLLRYLLSVIATEIVRRQTVKAIEERKEEIRRERAAARQNESLEDTLASDSQLDDGSIDVDENEVDVPGWEEKRRYLFALEVFTDFAKLVLYVVFFTVSVTFNGLPMHIMRDVYMTFASFSKRLSDYVNYKKATSDMNARYPDATTGEIRDDSCIVCRETMVAWEIPTANISDGAAAAPPPAAQNPPTRRDEGLRAKKLPCGHILHLRCLKAWLERQQVCPTCRQPVLTTPTSRQPQAPGAVAAANPQANQGHGQAVQQAGNNPAPQRRPNGARFFNIGPVRVGFLNGPAGQINDLVNQLQGAEAQQAPTTPRGGTTTLPPTSQSEGTGLGNTTTNANPGRLTQADIARIQAQISQEAERLATDRAQLHMLNLMATELTRLQTLHSQQRSHQATPESLPRTGETSITVPTTSLSGHRQQNISAGSDALPPGLVLPQGWTLMPLQARPGPPNEGMMLQSPLVQPQIFPQGLPFGAMVPPQPHPSQAHQYNFMQNPTATRATSSEHSTTNIGPTDASGSPLFVPADAAAQVVTDSSALPPATAPLASETSSSTDPSASATTSSQAQNTTPPWLSQNWTFEPQAGPSVNVGNESNNIEQYSDDVASQPDQGRNVQVEDVPDSQT